MAIKQILNNVASSNIKLNPCKFGTFGHNHFCKQLPSSLFKGRVLLGLRSQIQQTCVNVTKYKQYMGIAKLYRSMEKYYLIKDDSNSKVQITLALLYYVM